MDLAGSRKRKLIIFFSVFIFCWLFFLGYRYIRVDIQGCPYPCADFRFDPEDKYKDFYTINNAVSELNPYISKLSNYPPIILIFAYIFARMGDYSGYNTTNLKYCIKNPELLKTFYYFLGFYIVAFAAVCIFYAIKNNRADLKRPQKEKIKQFLLAGLVGTGLMLSAPSIFLIDRGNYLAVTVILIMLWAIFEEEKPASMWGAVFAALCAATKVYPIYLLLIYLVEKKYKKLITAIAVGATVTLIPFAFFSGSYIENVKEFVLGVLGFGGGSGVYSVYYTVGITGFIGFFFRMFGMMPSGRIIKLVWLSMGFILTLPLLGLLRTEKKTWKKLLVLTALMVFLTPNSFLYNTTYLFGPIFIMLMKKEKLIKRDIPYIVLCALLLVPKAYFHLDDLPGIVPLEYNTVNSGVLFDTLGYFTLLVYYFGERYSVIYKADRAKVGNASISRRPELSPLMMKLIFIGLTACSAIIALMVFWGVKDTVLACHDSLMEFVYARTNGWTSGYADAFKYGLARGRVGFIFPAVVAFRYLILAKGNYFAIWALQYIPVFMNIALLGILIGKKINKFYGVIFTAVFTGLLQIDIWHSLITCYPLDFMYGLFIMICSLWLYSDWLNRRSSKKDIWRLIVSLLLFYESLQVYEAFIVSSLIFALLSLFAVRKEGTGIKDFVKNLIPHFCVAAVYLAIMIWLRSHPVVDVAVSSIDAGGTIGSFFKPYFVYSFGMFPLVDMRIISHFKETLMHQGKRAFLEAVMGAVFAFAGSVAIMDHYRHLDEEGRKKIRNIIKIFTLSGLSLALTFAIPHSLIPSYQDWVFIGHAGGYVPTTICYFALTVVLCGCLFIFLHVISYRNNKVRILTALILAGGFAAAVLITGAINSTFRRIEAATGTWTSLKAQTFYALITDDTVEEIRPEIIYAPGLNGIHGKIEFNDSLADEELGFDTEVINDRKVLDAEDPDETQVAYYIYDGDAYAGILVYVDDLEGRERSWKSGNKLYIVSPSDGTFRIDFRYANTVRGSTTVEVQGGSGTYIDIPGTIYVGSIDIDRIA